MTREPGTFVRLRRTRKDRRCDSCRRLLKAGTVYALHTASPRSDAGSGQWRSLATCGESTRDCLLELEVPEP